MATTYNWTNESIVGTKSPHDTTQRGYKPFILRNYIDTTLQTVATDDSIIQALNVPAGTLVLGAWINVITVEGTGATDCNLGVTAVDANRWSDAADLNAATGVIEEVLTFDAPLYFATADTIDLLSVSGGTALDSAQFEIMALCVQAGNVTIDAGGQQYAAQA